jgi:hypothetical protein
MLSLDDDEGSETVWIRTAPVQVPGLVASTAATASCPPGGMSMEDSNMTQMPIGVARLFDLIAGALDEDKNAGRNRDTPLDLVLDCATFQSLIALVSEHKDSASTYADRKQAHRRYTDRHKQLVLRVANAQTEYDAHCANVCTPASATVTQLRADIAIHQQAEATDGGRAIMIDARRREIVNTRKALYPYINVLERRVADDVVYRRTLTKSPMRTDLDSMYAFRVEQQAHHLDKRELAYLVDKRSALNASEAELMRQAKVLDTTDHAVLTASLPAAEAHLTVATSTRDRLASVLSLAQEELCALKKAKQAAPAILDGSAAHATVPCLGQDLRQWLLMAVYLGCVWLTDMLLHKTNRRLHTALIQCRSLDPVLAWCGFFKTKHSLTDESTSSSTVIAARFELNYVRADPKYIDHARCSTEVGSILQLSTGLGRYIMQPLVDALPSESMVILHHLIGRAFEQGYCITSSPDSRTENAHLLTEEPYWSICYTLLVWAMWQQKKTCVEAMRCLHPAYQRHLWMPEHRHHLFACIFRHPPTKPVDEQWDAMVAAPTLARFWAWHCDHARNASISHNTFYAASSSATKSSSSSSSSVAPPVDETTADIVARLRAKQAQQVAQQQRLKDANKKKK